ncbi:MAG: addiction module protein, partial [Synechococcaceae cyanobacterium]
PGSVAGIGATAMALWDSLDEGGRSDALPVDADLCTELDRRWAAHLQNPTAAVPWEQVCGLLDRDRSGQETSWW